MCLPCIYSQRMNGGLDLGKPMTSSLSLVRPNFNSQPPKTQPSYSPGRRSSAVTTHVTLRLEMPMNDSTPSCSCSFKTHPLAIFCT